jgi:hypothetical protein
MFEVYFQIKFKKNKKNSKFETLFFLGEKHETNKGFYLELKKRKNLLN